MSNSKKVELYLKKNHPDIEIDRIVNNADIEKVEIWGKLYEIKINGGTFSSFKNYFEHY